MAKERINRLKEPRKPFKLVILELLKKLTYLFILLLFAGLIYVIDSSDLFEPKISWEFEGSLTTETAQYDRLIKPLLNNKYLIDLSQLKDRVERYPWVAKAEVSRLFWNKIRIAIVRHDIAMRWGSEGYISNQGVLFKPNLSIDSDAPIAIVSEDQIEQFYVDFINYRSILGNQALPSIKVMSDHDFYDYDSKYFSNKTEYLCPSDLSEQQEKNIRTIAMKAFNLTGASDWGRVDFILDKNKNPYLLEINTVPGMTSHSLVPMAAKAAGMNFEQLVLKILHG